MLFRCGICDCEGDYTGKFCEFSPDSCNKAQNGKICAGRGLCRNGICECNGPWIGDDCDCPIKEKSLQQCTDPFSKKVQIKITMKNLLEVIIVRVK